MKQEITLETGHYEIEVYINNVILGVIDFSEISINDDIINELTLDQQEYFLEYNGSVYCTESNVSGEFDNMISECYPDINKDDKTMLAEMYNNWTDSLCKDGELTALQYHEYTYQGELF